MVDMSSVVLATTGPIHWKHTFASAFASLRETYLSAKGAFTSKLVLYVVLSRIRFLKRFWLSTLPSRDKKKHIPEEMNDASTTAKDTHHCKNKSIQQRMCRMC